MDLADRVVRHLCHVWGIPLLAGPLGPGDRSLEPVVVLRTVLGEADARIFMAGALWLSLLEGAWTLGEDVPKGERRRAAYLCEIARCLGLLRGEPASRHPRSRPSEVAGLIPASWAGWIPLFPSPAPVVPSSRFGIRWGIREVLPFSDYACFQRKFLERRRGQEAA